jgi:DNA-binding winged helix-turn-helix (wHTH) protein
MSETSEPAIDLAAEPDFVLGAMTVRPRASEVVLEGAARRVEPRVMQVLVALARARGVVVSRDELLALCWEGVTVSDDAVTRAVGQVRRLAYLAPAAFAVETIPKIGYRLTIPAEPAAAALSGRPLPKMLPVAVAAAVALFVSAGVLALRTPAAPSSPPADAGKPADPQGTENAEARDRYLRATALLSAGGRENALRAEQLLREALDLDQQFHAAKETLVVALLSVAAFVPERAGEAHAEISRLLGDEMVETPHEWRGHVMRGFELALEGDWLAAEHALASARRTAPPPAEDVVNGLEIFLHGSVGRISDSLDLVMRQAQRDPLSHDRSRVLQQWLDRAGRREEAEAEYLRSRDLSGDRSAMELAALVRALGAGDPDVIEERFARYRETDWGRAGDDALFAVRGDRGAALEVLREQIEGFREPGAMPPFLAAAWAGYLGDVDLAAAGLRASPESLFATSGLLWDPVFAAKRRSAAFEDLVRDLGYVDYWRATGEWGDFCRPLGPEEFECS